MSHDKQSALTRLETRNHRDLDAQLVDQALKLFFNENLPNQVFSRQILPPEFDAKCIAGIPESSKQPNDKGEAHRTERMEELCRCVMVLPPNQGLFPNLLICEEMRKDSKY